MIPDCRASFAKRHLPRDLAPVQIDGDERRVRRLGQRNPAEGAAVIDRVRRSPWRWRARLRRRARALRRPRGKESVLPAVVAVLPRYIRILQVVLAERAD